MSRIGKQPVKVPAGVEVSMSDRYLSVKGAKGSLSQWIDPRIVVEVQDGAVVFTRGSDEPDSRALHGLYRALCQNMVVGVTKGYEKRLEIHGVGYQCSIDGKKLLLNVGFANTLVLEIPSNLQVNCPNNTAVDVAGADKQGVGQFAARIRATRPSEPYKGKGIRYQGEQIVRKAGKSMAAG